MKRLLIVLVPVLLLALLAGCATAPTQSVAPSAEAAEKAAAPAAETAEKPAAAQAPEVVLAGTFTDPASGIQIGFPDKWTAVSNAKSVGVTMLSEDWQAVVIATLHFDAGITASGELAGMKSDLQTGKEYSGLKVTDGATATVFGKAWVGYSWKGHYDAVKMDYAGRDVVVPYGKNFLRVTTYAPAERWAAFEPSFAKVLASLVAPAADFAYVPPPPKTEWMSFTSSEFGLSLSYPPTWIAPMAPWEGKGIWLNAPDYLTSVVIWVRDGTDPAADMKAWEADLNAGKGPFVGVTLQDGPQTKILGEQRPIKVGAGKNAFGTACDFVGAFVPYKGKMLYILAYAASGDPWKAAQEIFPRILASLAAK